MSAPALLFIAIGLSMDAFAVALCKGLGMKKLSVKGAATVGLWFGGFQALMPLLGYWLGSRFERYITAIDHWIAFVLLGFIGLGMVRSALQPEDTCPMPSLSASHMLPLALATSIDALAVGITLALLRADILLSVCTIGLTTFCLSMGGVWAGHRFGLRFKAKAEMAGGILLILMGIQILLSHLGLI